MHENAYTNASTHGKKYIHQTKLLSIKEELKGDGRNTSMRYHPNYTLKYR